MSKTKYPIYIPSKGRYDNPLTATRLTEMGLPFYYVVEPTEAEQYQALGLGEVLVLPFHDLGQGSIPARNWIWEHAIEHGAERHWIMDDNVRRFYRMNYNRRIPCQAPGMFRCVEEWCDRYTNVAFAGFQNPAFVRERGGVVRTAFALNTRVYSVTLINSALPYRWRGRYNEDTDICLRALKDGWVTCLLYAFLAAKAATSHGDGKSGTKGGNSLTLYNKDADYRREFAESLKRQHPDVVEVTWKYGRWHHSVNYTPFKRNKLQYRAGVTPTELTDEFGMRLIRVAADNT